MEEANQTLERENLAMTEEIDRLENDETYIEEIARKELDMLRPDEIMYDFRSQK